MLLIFFSGFPEYVNVLKRFQNLRSVSRFDEVRAAVEFRTLMNGHANEKTQALGVEFMVAAFKKALCPHREFLDDLAAAGKQKSRDAYISFRAGMFEESKDPAIYQV